MNSHAPISKIISHVDYFSYFLQYTNRHPVVGPEFALHNNGATKRKRSHLFPVVETSFNNGSLILIVQIIKERNEVHGIARRSSKAEKQFPQLVF